MDRELEIKQGASIGNAAEITKVAGEVASTMEELNDIFTKTAPGMELEWAEELRSRWESFYDADTKLAIEEMKNSASKIEVAVKASQVVDRG